MLKYKYVSKHLLKKFGGDIVSKQQFNPEEYAKLKQRIEVLKSRIELDKGAEQEAARRLLAKVKAKLKAYESTHDIPSQSADADYRTTCSSEFWSEMAHGFGTKQETQNQRQWTGNPNFKWHLHFEGNKNYYEDCRSENELVYDLGILYAIFGSTYQTVLNYHVYKIRFKRQIDKGFAFYRVRADVYEDDVRICENVNIGFWPASFGDDKCGDMEFSIMSPHSVEKYNNGCNNIYLKLLDGLKDLWNQYFDEQSAKSMYDIAGYIESGYQNSDDRKPEVQLTKEQRNEVIKKTDEDIDLGLMKNLEYVAGKIAVKAYKPYGNLQVLLEESGVVYKVNTMGPFVWNNTREKFEKLVGYEYDRDRRIYTLYLL